MAEPVDPVVLPPEEGPPGSPPRARGGLSFFWRLRASLRLLRDPTARGWEKLLLVLAVAYVVFPFDLVPDVPVAGWVDDLGVVAIVAAILNKALSRYRT